MVFEPQAKSVIRDTFVLLTIIISQEQSLSPMISTTLITNVNAQPPMVFGAKSSPHECYPGDETQNKSSNSPQTT